MAAIRIKKISVTQEIDLSKSWFIQHCYIKFIIKHEVTVDLVIHTSNINRDVVSIKRIIVEIKHRFCRVS